MKLIPFDLERAIAGNELITKKGKEVTQFFRFDKAFRDEDKIFVVIDGKIKTYNDLGEYAFKVNDDKINDLFMKPKKKKLYICVLKELCKNYGYHDTSGAFLTKEEADQSTKNSNSQTIEIEIDV